MTVLASTEQPDGNAAAAELATVNDQKPTSPTVATDSQTPAPRTRDNNQPTDCAAPKDIATHFQRRRPSLAHNKTPGNVTDSPGTNNSTARANTAEIIDLHQSRRRRCI